MLYLFYSTLFFKEYVLIDRRIKKNVGKDSFFL